MLRNLFFLLAAFVATGPHLTAQITVSFPASVSSRPLDGRVLLLLSTDPPQEPRMQIDDSPRSQIVFGTTVDGLAPDQAVTITSEAAGYPIRSLDQVPAGRLLRAGGAQHLPDLPPRQWHHGEAGAGPRRRPALEPRPRQSLFQAG